MSASTGNPFFDHPILNSPYALPARHWELDANGQPTQRILDTRRKAEFISPIPQPKKRKPKQQDIVYDEGLGLSTEKQQFATSAVINDLRFSLDQWRRLPSPSDWLVTPETTRLLQHWRHHNFQSVRPFFCQVEAVETVIWLTEVAPKLGKSSRPYLAHLANANHDANPDLFRLALKLATGAGKTTVMAMLIAWQTINQARHENTKLFTRGFLIVAPGLTIKDRLRVLQPNDPDSYYENRELVPPEMLADIKRAKIVITNYHAFKLRDRLEIAKGTRNLLQGRGPALNTLETEGQMIQRVMPELMGLKNIIVLNDEAHHCYREKVGDDREDEGLKGEDRQEAEKNKEAARMWISGLEAVNRQLGITRVIDLSATPFFLRGSGYPEGTLFTWTMSDFSLMDAIESGIVKLPRVPVADNIPGAQVPIFRNLWEHIRTKMPKKGRAKGGEADPLDIPVELQTALEALYGHYVKTFDEWRAAKIPVPPCFIVVCNNTSTSKLVYDYISGFTRKLENDQSIPVPGKLPLFRNTDEHGNPEPRPRTLLIDSSQLESGEALDDNFRTIASAEIEQFRRERVERSGNRSDGESESDQELLREVMNTVGKQGRLGESIRCVVSVSMLTEGWDANTVTHVLGVRAFGTQLLCEQVIGRALRRQSYELNREGLFDTEYADVLGIPFDFNAEPVIAPIKAPPKSTQVKAVRPERDHLEIRFPRVQGYRVELPTEEIGADFTDDSVLELTPALVGPSKTRNEGIIGEGIDLTLDHSRDTRQSTILYHLSHRLVAKYWRDAGEEPRYTEFNKLKRVAKQWLDNCLKCSGGTYPAQLLYQSLADTACDRITAAITRKELDKRRPVKAVLDPYNPTGSTNFVRFNTTKETYTTDSRRCHVNYVTLDSGWEGEFCRVVESHPRVVSYVKNQGLNFEIPYLCGSENRKYLPDFIVVLQDGLHLLVEVKGYRREDAKDKKTYAETYWVPGVNNDGRFGRWAFVEFTEIFELESEFAAKLEIEFNRIVESASAATATA